MSPLYCVIFSGAALLAHGADAGLADKQGMTAVHWACEMGRPAHIAALARAGCDVDARDARGNTALHASAIYGRGACVRALLALGAYKLLMPRPKYRDPSVWG